MDNKTRYEANLQCLEQAFTALKNATADLRSMATLIDDVPDKISIIPRGETNLSHPIRAASMMTASDGIYLHWSAGRTSGSLGDSKSILAAMLRYHTVNLGWRDIGYSFAIDNFGQIFELRGWGIVGAHTRGHNNRSHGVCWLGGRDRTHDKPSSKALQSMSHLVAEHNDRYGEGFVRGHMEAPRVHTECPGPHIMEWLHQRRTQNGWGS